MLYKVNPIVKIELGQMRGKEKERSHVTERGTLFLYVLNYFFSSCLTRFLGTSKIKSLDLPALKIQLSVE